MGHVECVFQSNAKKLVKDAIYYTRIQATNLYFQNHPKEAGSLNKNEGSSNKHLTEDQYREVSIQFVLIFLLIVVIDIICILVCAGDGSMDGARSSCVLCLVPTLGFQSLLESVSTSQTMSRNQS
jgi:NADH:ubiquinone oxidoreductase subunit 3 (subunit A)